MNIDDLTYVVKNQLDKDFCEHCIEKFKKDDAKVVGITDGGLQSDVKKSTDLYLSKLDNWKEEDNVFFESLSKNLEIYRDWVPDPLQYYVLKDEHEDTGYQIQETKPGEFYTWHHDQLDTRHLTFIWYLNDVYHDGYTEFISGLKIQPEMGKMLIFPGLWPWVHRGYPPKSENKYICTGWIRDKAVINSQNNIST